MRTFLVWMLERLAEIVVGTLILVGILGMPISRSSQLLDNLVLAAFLVTNFYVLSGYIFSAAYFAGVRRISNAWRKAAILAVLFAAHFLFFSRLLFDGTPGDLLLILPGMVAVAIINWIGAFADRPAPVPVT